MDRILVTKDLRIERKSYYVDFRENDRGQFLRIVEESMGRRNTLIVPSLGLGDFLDALEEVLTMASAANDAKDAGSPRAAPSELQAAD